jgi:hypothetical protein
VWKCSGCWIWIWVRRVEDEGRERELRTGWAKTKEDMVIDVGVSVEWRLNTGVIFDCLKFLSEISR